MTPPFTDQDKAAVAYVADSLAARFKSAGDAFLLPVANDVKVSPVAMLFGLIQAHVTGLAHVLGQLDDPTRDRLIAGVPAQLSTILRRAANERG